MSIDNLTKEMEKLQRYETAKQNAFARLLEIIQVLGNYQTIGALTEIQDKLENGSAKIIASFLARLSSAIIEQKIAFKKFPLIVSSLDDQLKLIGDIEKLAIGYRGMVAHYLENPIRDKREFISDLNQVYSKIYTAMQSFITLSRNIVNRKNFEEKKADYALAA